MAAQSTRLLKRMEVAEGTMAFFFERPPGFEFKSGQSADFTLVNPPETDAEGNTRAFSIASPPHERDLMIATRMRNTAFKRVLKSMPVGTELQLDGPFGSLTLHNKSSRAGVFLAGGIGITPFRSMVLRAAKEELPQKIYLFYSNRTLASAPFLEELLDIQKRNTNFRLIATIDKGADQPRTWQGETGHIDREMLKKHLPTLEGPLYYLAGPPGMVSAMLTMLNAAGINDEDIKSESFSGY